MSVRSGARARCAAWWPGLAPGSAVAAGAGSGSSVERKHRFCPDVTITQVTNPPLPVIVTGTRIEIPDGIAVAVDVVGTDEDGDTHTDIDVTGAYSSTLGVADTDTSGRFVL